MNVKTKIIDNSNIIEIILPSNPNILDHENSIEIFFRQKEAQYKRCLVNCSNMLNSLEVFDLFHTIRFAKQYDNYENAKEAILFPKYVIDRSHISLFEALVKKLGLNIKYFNDRDRAVEWLKT